MATILTRKQGAGTFPKTFISLLDTPATYLDSTNKYLRSTGSALEFTAISGAGTTDHSALSNLDYSNSGHTGFASTVHVHDDRYYTESEIDGMLITTFSGLSDTPSLYEDGKYLRSTASGTEWATISGAGVTDHSALTHLDYASSGHTGFASTADLATTSGDLQSQIDDKSDIDHLHDDRYYTETELNAGQLDNRYYTEGEVNTISGSLSGEIDADIVTFSGTIDHDTIINTHNLTTDINHDQLANYSIDEHRTIDDSGLGATDLWSAQKISDEIASASGTTNHAALDNLDYASSGHTGFASTADLTTTSGDLQSQIDDKSDIDHLHDDRYYTETELNNGQLDNRYYTESEVDAQWITNSGTIDHDTIVNTHNLTTDIDHDQLTNYAIGQHRTIDDAGSGSTDLWSAEKILSTITTISGELDEHNELKNIQGGTTDEYYHLTSAQHTDLTDGGNTTLHKHDDRYYTETETNTISGSLNDKINALDYYTTSEVDTISGALSAEIDADITTHEVGSSHDSRYYTETELDTGQLDSRYYTETELDGGQLDSRYYTEAETDIISGSLQTQIDSKDNYQSWSFAVDGVTKDAITSNDVLDFVSGDNITITRTADDQITISGTPGGGSPNHDELNNLDYASAGHTGFVSTTDLTTTSGTLQSQIDDKSDVGHDHDGAGGWMIKNSDYVANISDKIMLDSSGGPFTITLPSNPSLSDSVAFLDMTGTCGTNNVTVTVSGGGCEEYVTPSGNAVDFSPSGGYTPPTASGADFTFCIDGDGGAGEKIMGLDENLIINIDNSAFELVYSTAVWGWRIF